jgi:signal transduction histidine kinase
VHVEVEADGVARTLVATKQAGGVSLPAMSLAAARLLRPALVIEPGALLRPDFRPAPSRMPAISAVDLVDHRHDTDAIAGRLVFVGVTATGSGDRLVVPTDPGPAPAPGVLVHASATASLLSGGLVTPTAAPWILVAAFAAAAATQVARDRAGVFRPFHLALVLAAVLLGCLAALQAGHLLLAPAPLLLAPVAAVLLREAAESRTAQQRSGRLLGSLLQHLGVAEPAALPTTAEGRLAALSELQDAVLRDDRARRALLDGLSDGVVMWNGAGEVVIANPAARRLWGSEPERRDLELAAREREPSVRPGGAEVAVTTIGLDDGGLAILRDVTAELELERRRRDMQRLVSHELKTPLASIAGLGEAIERYELDRDEQRRVASLIRDESTRLGSLVTTFLDLERLGAGGWQGEVELVDLAELVGSRLDILGQAARARGQRIDRELERGVRARVESDLFARVVDNLLGNAVKYSPEGSTVTVGVRRDAGDAVLTVTDKGPGIPEDAIAHLFERFYRVPGSRGGGSGLGLALVQEVVDWHGGCIEVDSTIGRGTTFTVRLPEESEGHATQGPGR